MDPFESLNDEHRLIERMLSALLSYTSRLDDGAEPGDLGRFVTFFERFADSLHHRKEEGFLFEAMIEAGFPRAVGPIGMMLHEHDEGRRLVGALREAAARAGSWTPEDRALIRGTAKVFADLLLVHIRKEDTVLYPMARRTLTDEALAGIAAEFDEMLSKGDLRAERDSSLDTASLLIVRYQRPAAPVLAGTPREHLA